VHTHQHMERTPDPPWLCATSVHALLVHRQAQQGAATHMQPARQVLARSGVPGCQPPQRPSQGQVLSCCAVGYVAVGCWCQAQHSAAACTLLPAAWLLGAPVSGCRA
jgi:hypothetical protein